MAEYVSVLKKIKASAAWILPHWDLAVLILCITLMGLMMIDVLLPEPRLEISINRLNAEALSIETPVNMPESGDDDKLHQDITVQKSVNINAANSEELQRLPGIGSAMASRILNYRTQRGRFTRIEDLQNVRGIGPKTLEKIRPQVRLND